jgi:hypothetical protein
MTALRPSQFGMAHKRRCVRGFLHPTGAPVNTLFEEQITLWDIVADIWSFLKRLNFNIAVIFLVGVYLTFSLAPLSATQGRQLSRLPEVDAAEYESIEINTRLLVSGTLQDNEESSGGLVAYKRSRWMITEPADPAVEDDEPGVEWLSAGQYIPDDLRVAIEGGAVTVKRTRGVMLTGRLVEVVVPPEGEAETIKGWAVGTARLKGLRNGDTVTVVGSKAAGGVFYPEEIYGGSRADIIAEYHRPSLAQRVLGVSLMIVSAIVGVLWERRIRAKEKAKAEDMQRVAHRLA